MQAGVHSEPIFMSSPLFIKPSTFSNTRNPFLWQNLDPNNLSEEGHKSTLLWSFEVLPAPAAQFVKPSVVKESPLDEYFPPVIIDAESRCNCANPSPYCLVAMIASATENVVSIASEQESDSPAVSSEEECSAGEEVEDVNAEEYFTDRELVLNLTT